MAGLFGIQLVITEWNGPRFRGHIDEANKRLAGSIAYDAQNHMKEYAHVMTGRMRGAVTVEPPNSGFMVDRNADPHEYGKSREAAIAAVESSGEQASVEVGSYVPYAFIVETIQGNRFILPGLDAAQGNFAQHVAQVREELGLG